MGKDAPSPPAAPDPAQTAAAQGQINKDTAITQAQLNRVNQITPYGNLTYSQPQGQYDDQAFQKALQQYYDASNAQFAKTGKGFSTAPPTYDQFLAPTTQTVTLSPDEQTKLGQQEKLGITMNDTAQQQLDRLKTSLATPVNYDNASKLITSIDPNSDIYKQTEAAYMSRVNPQLDQSRQSLEARLASQGIAIGSDAYNKAMALQGQTENDARTQGQLTATQIALQNANLNNTGRQQTIAEDTSIRNQPLNEISALMGGGQVQTPSFPGYSTTNIQPADITGPTALQYQGQLAGYNAQQQQQNAGMGGLFGIGGSVIGAGLMPGGFFGVAPLAAASDRRVKNIIRRVGEFGGFPLYLFKYIWDEAIHLGVLAQDVEKEKPWAVHEIGGIKHVAYGVL